MKKYKVYYTAYDNSEWRHRDDVIVVDAEDEAHAKKIVEDKSDYFEDYYVKKIVEEK